MTQLGDVEFEYVFLKDLHLEPCRGCGVCLDKGEDRCPLKDDRAMLEGKIEAADGVVFASPTYTFNVTGLMKNFFDRFAYVCHRPRFFKSALVLTTSGIGAGSGVMLTTFALVPQSWGFRVAGKLGVTTNGLPEFSTPPEQADRRIGKAARKFYRAVAAGRPKPGILGMAMFLTSRSSIMRVPQELYDYGYWKGHGWFAEGTCYYHDTQAGAMKKSAARLLARCMGWFV